MLRPGAQIFVLTQFNSKSLNSYLQKTYDLGHALGGDGHVEVVAAAQVRAHPSEEQPPSSGLLLACCRACARC